MLDGDKGEVLDRAIKATDTQMEIKSIMEDLKAGVPRTAYHGVIPLRVGGVMVFLAPSFAVDQDITQRKPP